LPFTGLPQVVLAQALSQAGIALSRSSQGDHPTEHETSGTSALSLRHANVESGVVTLERIQDAGETLCHLVPADLWNTLQKQLLTDLQGRLCYNSMCSDNSMRLQIRGVCSFASWTRELCQGSFGSNDAESRQPGDSNHNPRKYGVKRMGADEALNLA